MSEKIKTPTEILGTSYHVEEGLMSLAEKYFGEDVSKLKSGLVGYSAESMAHIAKDGIFHRNSMYKEMFLNSAGMPTSINNFASQFKYVIPDATPSKATIQFAMNIDIIKEVAAANNGIFRIERNQPFDLGGFRFMLPYGVKLLVSGDAVIAEYDITESAINEGIRMNYASNPFIKTWSQPVPDGRGGNIKFLFLLLDIYQLEVVENEWEVLTENVTEQIIFDFGFHDQLVGFNVQYNSSYISKYFNTTEVPSESEYCFWSQSGDNEIQVFFSTLERRFRPRFGSKVSVEVYVSRGINGNFTYNGDIAFKFSDELLEKQPVIIKLINQPAGGKDRPTFLEVKQELLHLQRTKDSIISDYDIASFFNTVAAQNFQNGSSVVFSKKRDDIIRRVFAAYLLLTDDHGELIPTNTGDVELNYSFLEDRNFKIKPGTLVMYDKSINRLRFLRDDEFPDNYIGRKGVFVYAIPYLMEVRLSPFPRIAYYDAFINKDFNLVYSPTNARVEREFLLNEIHVERNPVLTQDYRVTCNLSVSGDEFDRADMSVLGVIRNGEVPIGWVEFEFDPITEQYFTVIKTYDNFDSVGRIEIINSIHGVQSTSLSSVISLPENVQMDIGIFFRESSGEVIVEDSFTAIPPSVYSGKTQVVHLRTVEDLSLFKSKATVMSSDLYVNSNGTAKITDIPFVAADYYFNTAKTERLMESLDQYTEVISDNLKRLENSNDVDVKFFNTFGISQLYDVPYVNISLELSINLKTRLTPELDEEIRQSIIQFVRDTNNAVDRRLLISNLTTHLENTFSQIGSIAFNGIDGLNQQVVNYLPSIQDEAEQTINYTPEFLSIGVSQGDAINPNKTSELKINYI